MAFDQATRNRLQRFVSDARKLLSEEFTQQLQNTYGLDPITGNIAALSDLPSLSPSEQQTATLLRDTMAHYLAASHKANPYTDKTIVTAALDRIVREQAFTVLNRLAALRMAEARQFVIESISQGYQSKGFQLYQRIAGSALGETGPAYQRYLFSMFDELSLDLTVLFDRYSAQGRLFPRETVLQELLVLINYSELDLLWVEDETIGWVYQYWNVREEIDQARESRAPRNSREMAVRNQFFTPRYVVEFLTDNTVGKTWYEMLQGQTSIVHKCAYLVVDEDAVFLQEDEQLSEEQAENDTQYILYRKAKDPRCLKAIDPACGSGHFLLYVFDLMINIYEEAWEKEPVDGWPIREGFPPLKSTYVSFEEFQKDIPALIIANNLYGIDIDSRAIQIAGLALWLRGQRYWNDANVNQGDRPTIKCSNLICAEPLNFETSQLMQYKSKLPFGQSNILAELLNVIAEKMALAGEMGILLKLEKDIKTALGQVENEFKRLQDSKIQDDLFGREHIDKQLNLKFSVQGLNSQFFNGAEKLLLGALSGFLESSTTNTAYKNKLFADDIAHSLAFVDLMKLRFDAIVMNPPFGKPSVDSEPYMEVNYPDNPSDVYQAFVDRGQELLVPGGFLGAITSRTGFFLGTFENWRNRVVLRRFRPLLLADFGEHVLDAMVETAAFVFRSITLEEKQLNLHNILRELEHIEISRNSDFSIPKYQKARSEKLSREQALYELNSLESAGFVEFLQGNGIKYQILARVVKSELAQKTFALQYPKMACIRLIDLVNKQEGLIQALNNNFSNLIFDTDPSSFNAVPGAPFSYWISNKVRETFKNNSQFANVDRSAKEGLTSGDDFRFGRMWWELAPSDIAGIDSHEFKYSGPYCSIDKKWQTFAKGGGLSPFYSDMKMVCNWEKHGLEIDVCEKSFNRNLQYQFRSGVTWTLRSLRFTPAVFPRGTIFSVRSKIAVFSDGLEKVMISIGNTNTFDSLYKIKLGQTGRPEFIVGVANVMPFPEAQIEDSMVELEGLFQQGYRNAISTYLSDETSRIYVGCWFDRFGKTSLHAATAAYKLYAENHHKSILEHQKKNDEKALELYRLNEHDFSNEVARRTWATVSNLPVEYSDDVEGFISKDLMSNIFGRMFGRFLNAEVLWTERDPFSPLPVPALDDNLSNVLSIHRNLKNLLMQGIAPVGRHFTICIDDLLPELLSNQYLDSTNITEEILLALNVNSLSQYFSKPSAFFDYHLSQYSGSSRMAPVYLPLSSSSGAFTVWLFYLKLSRATLYSVLNDVIGPTVNVLEEGLKTAKQGASSDEAEAATLLEEIKDFRDSIKEILIDGYECDIDDGVVISAAPLRKLFKHSGWSDELDHRWEALSAGEYEWSSLAYYYWPERVIKKCHQDRSIAIAHDVEGDLWEEVEVPAARGRGTKWVWQPKDMTEADLDAYIQYKISEDKSLS